MVLAALSQSGAGDMAVYCCRITARGRLILDKEGNT